MSLLDNIKSVWKLDGNSIDMVGGNNGIDSSVIYVPGKIERCASFSLFTSSRIVVTATAYDAISFWFNPSSTHSTYGGLFTLNGGFGIFYYGPLNRISIYSGGDHFFNYTFTPNNWHHVVINNYQGVSSMYVNGSFVDSDNVNLPPIVQIGNDTSSEAYNGLIDEINIWEGRILTQSEILKLYNNGDGLPYPFSVNSNKSKFLNFF